MFSIDYLEYPWDTIEQKIYQERMRYQNIYQVIEQYLSEHSDIIIGGSMGINLLLKKERTIDDFEYELYAGNAFAQATQLINLLAEKTNDTMLFLKTTIPSVKYQIFVDLRLIATFIHLSESAINIVEPIKVKSFDQKHNLLVLSPEIQLIDIYRALYSPSQADNWQSILYDESKLYKIMKPQHILENIQKNGGDEITIGERRSLETQLFKQFIAGNENIVLIGEHALKILLNIEISTTVIQIISQNEIEEDFTVIEKIIKNHLKRNIPIVKLTRELNIMKDFRIRRTTIKVGDVEFGQKEIMYIYNSAYYDLIPFNTMKSETSFIQIGNPFVLLRFLLIDFWMLRWIKQLGSIDESFAQQRLNSILQKMMDLRTKLQASHSSDKKINQRKEITIDPQYFDEVSDYKIFQSQSHEYIGFYDDEIISQKIFIKDLTKRFYDYYPIDYKKKFGQYRILTQ